MLTAVLFITGKKNKNKKNRNNANVYPQENEKKKCIIFIKWDTMPPRKLSGVYKNVLNLLFSEEVLFLFSSNSLSF